MDFWRVVSAESDRIIEKKKRRKQKEQEAKKIKHYNITGTITVNKSDDESSILR